MPLISGRAESRTQPSSLPEQCSSRGDVALPAGSGHPAWVQPQASVWGWVDRILTWPGCSRQGGPGLSIPMRRGWWVGRAAGWSPESSPWPSGTALYADSPSGAPMPVSLAAPPQFQETPPAVLEVQELEPVTLRCVARGSPLPRVTWKLRGKDLGQGQGQGQVQVSPGGG